MSRYGNKILDSTVDSIVEKDGRYGNNILIQEVILKPIVLKASINFDGVLFARSDTAHEVYIENGQALFINTENNSIKTDFEGGN